jgi:glutathione S-transferase
MALEVYLDPCTINCRKVLAGLDLVKTPYNIHHIDYFAGQQKSPEYLKINPGATIPSAVHDELVITESNAILQYISSFNPSS